MLTSSENQQGFTLIELLIVVAIIGIIAAVAAPQYNAYRDRGYHAAAHTDLKNLKTALESYFTEHRSYP